MSVENEAPKYLELSGTEFTTNGHVSQFDALVEGFLIGRANNLVDAIADDSGYPSTTREGTLNFREREFQSPSGPVVLETDSDLYMEGRDVGFMLCLWRRPERTPARAVINYRLADTYSEEWSAKDGTGRIVDPEATDVVKRPLRSTDCMHGAVKGPIDELILAMSRDLALAIENPVELRARASHVLVNGPIQEILDIDLDQTTAS